MSRQRQKLRQHLNKQTKSAKCSKLDQIKWKSFRRRERQIKVVWNRRVRQRRGYLPCCMPRDRLCISNRKCCIIHSPPQSVRLSTDRCEQAMVILLHYWKDVRFWSRGYVLQLKSEASCCWAKLLVLKGGSNWVRIGETTHQTGEG